MTQPGHQTLLRIDSGIGGGDSLTRTIGDEVERRLALTNPALARRHLDLAGGIPHIDAEWVGASYAPEDQRSAGQRDRLQTSDDMIAMLCQADVVVLTAPVYNFSVPSVLKAWIDHVCRAGSTFRYTAEGPRGLLRDRPVYLVMASGGVAFGSAPDFASGYLRQVLGFIGIDDVRLIGAAGTARDAVAARNAAYADLEHWLPDPAARVA